MSDSPERQQMVLAQRVKRDVSHDHQFRVSLTVRKRGPRGRTGCEQLAKRLSYPTGGVREMRVGKVSAQGDQQICDGRAGSFQVDSGRGALLEGQAVKITHCRGYEGCRVEYSDNMAPSLKSATLNLERIIISVKLFRR